MIEFKEHPTKKRAVIGVTFRSPCDVFLLRVNFGDRRGKTKSIYSWSRRKTAIEGNAGFRCVGER